MFSSRLMIFVVILALACAVPFLAQGLQEHGRSTNLRADETHSAKLRAEEVSKLTTVLSSLLRLERWHECQFNTALYTLPAWGQLEGEKEVHLFPTRIVGGQRYDSRENAGSAAKKLSDLLVKIKPKFSDQFQKILTEREGRSELKALPVAFFEDDDSTRVMIPVRQSPKLKLGHLFPKDLTVRQVEKMLGKPEKVSRELVQTEKGERRPVVLTLYKYANGMISFAESDLSGKPGRVERIVLQVAPLNRTLFK